MAHLLLMCMIFVLFIRSSREAWIIGDSSLPRADDSMAVGAYNGKIFIIGGYYEGNALVEFDIATHSVTDHGKRAIMASKTDGAAQFWSQQGPILYIIDDTVFSIYDMHTRQFTANWKGITFLTGVGDDGCLASSALFLYVTGGDPDGIDTLQVLRLTTYSWITNPLPPTMQQRRQHHSCVLHNDYLWAFAGQWTPDKKNFEIANNERILATGDIAQNTWNYIDPLTVAIESHCAVAYQDIIYVIGGRDGDLTSFDFVHLVDANTGEVTVSPDRMQSVSQLGAPIIVDSTLYLFGGDPLTTEWQYCELDTTPPMPTTAVPTNQPTSAPSEIPTSAPIAAPSEIPTSAPVAAPSDQPTSVPSEHPTVAPFAVPSEMPTSVPSNQPTLVPSEHPTGAPVPSNQPTHVPSEMPTIHPIQPTFFPSAHPTVGPIAVPSAHPTVIPMDSPSNYPSLVPSKHPTDNDPRIHAPMPNEDATSPPTQNGFVGTSQSNYITTEASEESPLSEESEESLLFGRIVSLILWILLILAAVGMGKLCCRARARAKRDEQGMIEATNRQTNTGGTVSTTTADDTIDDWHTKQMNATNQMNGEQGQGEGGRDAEPELNDTDAEETSDSENLYEERKPSLAMHMTPGNDDVKTEGACSNPMVTNGYVEEPRDEQACVDCGLMKMGSLYDGLFYCHDCAAYYTVTPQ
eukprot:831622_1